MDFQLDSEQEALRDAVRGLLTKAYDTSETRREVTKQDPGWDEKTWRQLAEMGVLGLPFAEEDGGMGAGPAEVSIVAEEIGRVIAPEPFVEAVVLAGGLVAAAGTAEQRAEILGALAEGGLVPAFAHTEPASRYELAATGVTASAPGDAWTLNGRQGARAGRRSRRPADRQRGGRGRHRTVPRASPTPTASPARATDVRRRTRGPGGVRQHPGDAARRSRRRPVGRHRGDRRAGPDRVRARVARRDGDRAAYDDGVPQDAQAVRRTAHDLPGADVPGG